MRIALATALISFGSVCAGAEAWSDPHALVGSTVPVSTSYRELTSYPERLTYDVSWGMLSVGQATLSVAEIVQFSGRPAYHVVSTATSNGFCDTFYKVRDINESWVDAEKLSSLAYAKTLREGHFFRDEAVLYDAQERTFQARWYNRDGSYSVKTGTIPASVQDILSSLYFVRAQNLVPGQNIVLDVNTKDNWPLIVRVVRKEKISTPAGTFKTVLVEPGIRQEGIFIQKGRKLQIWLTDDPKKTPVQLKVEVFFGHVTAKLSKML